MRILYRLYNLLFITLLFVVKTIILQVLFLVISFVEIVFAYYVLLFNWKKLNADSELLTLNKKKVLKFKDSIESFLDGILCWFNL